MMSAWPFFVFGAPIAIAGLLACVLGLLLKRPWLLLLGGLSFVPSSFYIGGHPGVGFLLLLPLLPSLAALALHQGRPFWAGLLLVPNALAVLWLSVTTFLNLFGR
jgi:hypothetical protein